MTERIIIPEILRLKRFRSRRKNTCATLRGIRMALRAYFNREDREGLRKWEWSHLLLEVRLLGLEYPVGARHVLLERGGGVELLLRVPQPLRLLLQGLLGGTGPPLGVLLLQRQVGHATTLVGRRALLRRLRQLALGGAQPAPARHKTHTQRPKSISPVLWADSTVVPFNNQGCHSNLEKKFPVFSLYVNSRH